MQILSQNYLRKCRGTVNSWVKMLPLFRMEAGEVKVKSDAPEVIAKSTTIKLLTAEPQIITVQDDWKSYRINQDTEVFTLKHDCEILKVEWLTPYILFSYKQVDKYGLALLKYEDEAVMVWTEG